MRKKKKKIFKKIKAFFKQIKKKVKKRATGIKIGLKLFLLGGILIAIFFIYFLGLIYPNVLVAGISLGNLTPEEAIELLTNQVVPPGEIKLINQVEGEEQIFNLPLEAIDFEYDFQDTADFAFHLGRSGNPIFDLGIIFKNLLQKPNYGLRVKIDEEKLTEQLKTIGDQVAIEPEYPNVELEDDQVIINQGKRGSELDLQNLRIQIGQVLAFNQEPEIVIPIKEIDPRLDEQETEILKQRANNLIDKKLEIEYEETIGSFSNNSLFPFLDVYHNHQYSQEELEKIAIEISQKINRLPQEPVLTFQGGRVQEFKPAKDGLEVKQEELIEAVKKGLAELEETETKTATINLPVKTSPPKIQTGEINDLGIQELIGKGISYFSGSASSRIHNLSLAASRLNGVLIKPGEIFSFNLALGEVEKETGYQEAYIIKEGKTILDDGGGVCQVSTTLFRAVLDAGLPVVERRAHAYRVSYYEQRSQVGLDATVFSPTTDFKFKNDTPHHLLIQTATDVPNRKLTFELYGTGDGRKSEISKPIITDTTPPPDDLYVDEPTLPAGTIKQIDWKAWGAKVRFTYTVKRNNETIYQKTFYSNYQPWQAIFLRGTGQ